MLHVDGNGSDPLYRQIYDAVRDEILGGRVRPGQRLPSSRRLAETLSVSRSTTVLAFDMLLAEGYLEGRRGSGTFVSRELPEHLLHAPVGMPRVPKPARHVEPSPPISVHARSQTAARGMWHPGPPVPFRLGLPAMDEFPHRVWGRIAARLANAPGRLEWDYGDPAGEPAMRAAVAEHLIQYRGVDCTPEQILITSGSQQALDLCARVLVNRGEQCWMEDPGYAGAKAALRSAGVEVVPVPVDEDGLAVAAGRVRAPRARMVYITPSHQYPLGVAMCLSRRLELLEWARESDAWIVEDDYDSEYRYVGKPLAPLKTLDSGQRVVYVGTFSKTLFPALRIGYLAVPESLVDAFLAQRFASSRQVPTFEQSILAEFMAAGHLARHIRRMRLLYRDRLDALRAAAAEFAPDWLEIPAAASGMHVVAFLPEGTDDKDVAARARQADVVVAPLSSFRIDDGGRPGLLLGYTGFAASRLREAMRTLVKAAGSSLGSALSELT